jgi:hypothetical protein
MSTVCSQATVSRGVGPFHYNLGPADGLAVPRTRSIQGTAGSYSHVSKKDTCHPSDAALSRARPPISIGMGPAEHLNWLTKNGWDWGSCTYKSPDFPVEDDETVHICWARKKTGGKLSLRPKEIEVTTRVEVQRGSRFETGWWANCNAVKYRKTDKTGRMEEGFDTFVANEGRPFGKPMVLRTPDGTAYVQVSMSEHTFATHADLKDDTFVSGEGDGTEQGSRRGLSGRGGRH